MKEEPVQAAATHLKPVPRPPEELEGLFREHHDRVFRTAHRITGNAVDAEDVLQTVFLRLARRAEGVDLSPNPGSYLHRAAVNASLDIVRSRARLRSVALEEAEPELAGSPSLSPEAQHRDRELRTAIRRAIANLGARAAEIVALRYLEGYGNREIAEMLGTSQMVVGVVLHRARGRLKKEIGGFLEGDHEAHS